MPRLVNCPCDDIAYAAEKHHTGTCQAELYQIVTYALGMAVGLHAARCRVSHLFVLCTHTVSCTKHILASAKQSDTALVTGGRRGVDAILYASLRI